VQSFLILQLLLRENADLISVTMAKLESRRKEFFKLLANEVCSWLVAVLFLPWELIFREPFSESYLFFGGFSLDF
jgi:hypothetical protein